MEQSRLKNIVFLTRWYPHRYDPMPGLFVERHAEALASGFNIYVVYVHADDHLSQKYEMVAETRNNVNVIRVYYKSVTSGIPLVSSLKKGWRFFKYNMKGINEIRNNGHIHLYHVNILTRLGVIALYLKLVTATPYIITEHWSRYLPITNTYHGVLRKWVTRLVVRKASAVTTVTENLKNAMLAHGLNNPGYFVVPNVVDTQMFRPEFDSRTKNKKLIVHISCFEDRSKNISGMIRVIKKLSEQRTDFIVKMIGEGIDLDRMIELSKENNTYNTTIEFTGLLENENLAGVLKQADFLLMFSNYENMPVVINEALACGVPVLSSNAGGIPEVINPDNGVLVEKKDEESLLMALNTMLDNCRQYDKKKISIDAKKRFGKQAVYEQFSSIYNKAFTHQIQ